MIDARDDMWEEEKHCNYRLMHKLHEERYEPAKAKLRFFLTEIIKVTNVSEKETQFSDLFPLQISPTTVE